MKQKGFINVFFLLVLAIIGVGVASAKGALKPNVLGESEEVKEQKQNFGENKPKPVPPTTAFFEIQKNKEKTELKVTRVGQRIELEAKKREATHEAEKETEKDDEKALHDVNNALETKDIEVATDESGLVVRHGETEAETHFPLSVNTATRTLTVTTPAGTKTVTVLPDTAVNNLLTQGILSNVETAPATASGFGTHKVTLTEFNNEPAFEVNGTVEKKLFGVLSFGQGKKVFVSAQTGEVLSQSGDLLGQFLGLFSF